MNHPEACKFCGGKLKIKNFDEYGHLVICSKCLNRTEWNATKEGAINEWEEKRVNPNYSPTHQFTVAKCEECGEYYEPFCHLKHICKIQNSYPD